MSGLGDPNELRKHEIPLVLDQPSIGLKLKDHLMLRLGATIAQDAIPHKPLAAASEDVAAAAQGYHKLKPSLLPALDLLEEDVKSHLLNNLTPTHELLLVCIPFLKLDVRKILLDSLTWPSESFQARCRRTDSCGSRSLS